MARPSNTAAPKGAKADEATNLGWLNFKIDTKNGVKSFSARAGIPLNDDNEIAVMLVKKLATFPTDVERTLFLLSKLTVTFTEASAPIDPKADLWD